jgi:pyruvate kinase
MTFVKNRTEIRTGLLEGDDGRMEVQLVKGETIRITTNDEYMNKCTEKILWVDYKNITKVILLFYFLYIQLV